MYDYRVDHEIRAVARSAGTDGQWNANGTRSSLLRFNACIAPRNVVVFFAVYSCGRSSVGQRIRRNPAFYHNGQPNSAAAVPNHHQTGSGFGTLQAYNGNSSYITDLTTDWSGGNSESCGPIYGCPDPVALAVSSWTDSQIVIIGFTGGV
jgi:hypothetical protein